MLKISLLFKKLTNFTGKLFENSLDTECEMFRLLFLYEHKHMRRFSNMNQCTFKCEKIFMWHIFFFKQFVQLGVFSVSCVCVRVVWCVCVSIVFCISDALQSTIINKIFDTNWSQIWVFFQDLIKYILSLKNCNTICKKRK